MASPRHEPDGWPRLEQVRVELDPLPPRASPEDRARVYASALTMWANLWPIVLDALQWLRGAWYGMHHEVAAMRGELAAARLELLEELRKKPSVRPKLPSFSSFAPEQTIGGGIRLPEGQWEALQKQVAELAEGLEEAEQAKRDAEQREKGANDALTGVADTWKKRRDFVLFLLAVLVPLGSAFGYVASHWWHW